MVITIIIIALLLASMFVGLCLIGKHNAFSALVIVVSVIGIMFVTYQLGVLRGLTST